MLRACSQIQQAGATVAQVERLADGWLGSQLAVRLSGVEPAQRARPGTPAVEAARYSTPGMLKCERDLIASALARQNAEVAVARQAHLDEALAARRYLSGEQRELVYSLTRSGRGVEVVRAKAGAGKTTALEAARDAWERSGIRVVGCALSARAASELRDNGVPATTIARLTEELQRPGASLPRDGVLVIDEAGMVGTRTIARLAQEAQRADCKLVLVGDDRQLPEIDAGGAFRGLADRLGALELNENRRQQDPADRIALDALRDGHADQFVRSLAERDQLVACPTAGETRQQLVADWWHAAQHDGPEHAVMIAHRRHDVRELNGLARAHMRDAGRLGDHELDVDGRRFAEGDRIVCRHNAPRHDVINGDRATITRLNEDHSLEIRLDTGRHTTLPPDYVAGRRDTTPYLDHGYATTAHALQGATVQRSFILGGEDTYREWAYTAASRHQVEHRFYVTSPAPAGPGEHSVLERTIGNLDRSRAKTMALDVADLIPDR